MCVGWGRRKAERRRKCWGRDSKVERMDWWMNGQGCELELGKKQDNSGSDHLPLLLFGIIVFDINTSLHVF